MNKFLQSALILLTVSIANISAQNKITPQLYQSVDSQKMNHWVDSVFKTMTMDEKIGQLFFIISEGGNTEANSAKLRKLVKDLHLGGVLFSKSTPADHAELTNAAQSAAKIPLMITLDGEWGLSMRLSNTTLFPKNIMLGAIQNDSMLYLYGKEVARQCKLMGIHVNFAPDIDVNSNPDNPVIGYRAFGENPQRVAQHGIMYSKGLEDGGVLSVAKHFPGHGDTSTDSHFSLPLVAHNRQRLDAMELYPFKKYIEAGLSGIMIGHLSIPALDDSGQPSSLSEMIGTQLLKNEMGFSGLTFTDGLQMKGVANEPDFCTRALLAGNDVLLGPTLAVREYAAVKKSVADKIISVEQINEKCKKILAYKYILGVHAQGKIDTKGLVKNLNTPYAEWLNGKLNEHAMTLLKNNDNVLPFKLLNKRKIAAVSIGGKAGSSFHQMLKNYTDVVCYNVADGEGLAQLKKTLAPYNTLIISVHNPKINADNAIQSISQNKDVILTFFMNPYKMSAYKDAIDDADGVVLAYENTDLAQTYAAQGIFGGNVMDGKIPVTVENIFNEGDGLSTEKTRLSYDMPEEVGINSGTLDGIDLIVDEAIKSRAFPGCQVLVAKDGVIIYQRAFGSFEYIKQRAVTNGDLYDIASMTKGTAVVPAIMKLYDEKKISFKDEISASVPILKKTEKQGITIRQALIHETGLPGFLPYYMDAIDKDSYKGRLFSYKYDAEHPAQFDENTWTRTDFKFKPEYVSKLPKEGYVPLADGLFVSKSYEKTLLQAIADVKMNKTNSYMYSCLNFILLKEVVEKESKTDFSTYLQDNFYMPLGASSTMFNPLTKFNKNVIAPTERDDFLRKQTLRGYVHDEAAAFLGGVSGNSGIFSNANDLAKVYQMFLNNGTYGGERFYSEKTGKLFSYTRSANSRRGLGFDKPEARTSKSSPTSYSTPLDTYGHTGFTGTCFWVDPDNRIIYIFLSNRVHEKRTSKEISTLSIRQRIQEEIYKAMWKSGLKPEGQKNQE